MLELLISIKSRWREGWTRVGPPHLGKFSLLWPVDYPYGVGQCEQQDFGVGGHWGVIGAGVTFEPLKGCILENWRLWHFKLGWWPMLLVGLEVVLVAWKHGNMTLHLSQHRRAAEGQKHHFDSLKVVNGENFVLDRSGWVLYIFMKFWYGMIKI